MEWDLKRQMAILEEYKVVDGAAQMPIKIVLKICDNSVIFLEGVLCNFNFC